MHFCWALVILFATSAAQATAGEPTKDPGNVLSGLSFQADKGPVSVAADQLDFDYRQRVLSYRGKVVAEQGDTKLQADRVTLTLAEPRDGKQEIETVRAEGGVTVAQGIRGARADKIEFDQKTRTVVLTGNAELHDGPNRVSGERVTVYLDEQRSEVSGGGGRVSAVLFPGAKNEDAPAK